MHGISNKRVTVFVNASSGWDPKEDAPEKLQEAFEVKGWDAQIRSVQKGVDIAELSRCAVNDGCGVVVAGGGDGTINATASALTGTSAALGILPVGTLNHFARDLNIPLDLDQAAEVVLTGEPVAVDVGEVNGRIFINNSIIGLYPSYRFLKDKQEQTGIHRWAAFLSAILTVFRFNPFLRVRLNVDGKELVRRTPFIMVANNEHAMEGYKLGTRKSLREGRLWVYVMRPQGRMGLLRIALSLVFGQFRASKDFDIFPAEEVWVETNKRRLGVALDGEIALMTTPLHYRILPQSLKVIVPKGSTEE